MSAAQTQQLIDRIFEEEALVLGGLAAERRVDDAVVWQLVRSFDSIRERARRVLEGEVAGDVPEAADRPHPAIEEFLAKLEAA